MALADRNRELAALMAYCEASSGTPAERRLVIGSAFNRAQQHWRFKPTVAGVVLQRMQYSEFNADKIDNANLERGANAQDDDPVFQDCYAAYDEVLSAPSAYAAGGATHFYAKSIEPPFWTVGATLTLETEHLKFYSNVR